MHRLGIEQHFVFETYIQHRQARASTTTDHSRDDQTEAHRQLSPCQVAHRPGPASTMRGPPSRFVYTGRRRAELSGVATTAAARACRIYADEARRVIVVLGRLKRSTRLRPPHSMTAGAGMGSVRSGRSARLDRTRHHARVVLVEGDSRAGAGRSAGCRDRSAAGGGAHGLAPIRARFLLRSAALPRSLRGAPAPRRSSCVTALRTRASVRTRARVVIAWCWAICAFMASWPPRRRTTKGRAVASSGSTCG